MVLLASFQVTLKPILYMTASVAFTPSNTACVSALVIGPQRLPAFLQDKGQITWDSRPLRIWSRFLVLTIFSYFSNSDLKIFF